MRQIKFRGRHIKNAVRNSRVAPGEMVYGGYAVLLGEPHIIFDSVAWQVEPDSVQQLIAVDKNGKDIYEGDKVIRIEDKDDPDFDGAKTFPMYASFEDYGAIRDEEIVLAEEQS